MRYSITATVLGLVSRDYDFTPPGGERQQGTSHSLHLYDLTGMSFYEVKVPASHIGAIRELGQGELISVSVDVRGRDRGTVATLAGVPSVLGESFTLTGTASVKSA